MRASRAVKPFEQGISKLSQPAGLTSEPTNKPTNQPTVKLTEQLTNQPTNLPTTEQTYLTTSKTKKLRPPVPRILHREEEEEEES